MSDEKNKVEDKKLGLNELKANYTKLLRVREGMPGNLEKAKEEAKAERAAKEQEMNAAKARALKPAMDEKNKAIEAAAIGYKTAWSKATTDYEQEIGPAKARYEALLAEAKKDQESKVQSAKIGFNEAAEALHKELKAELEEIAQKHHERLASFEKQYSDQVAEVDVQLAKLKTAIERLESKSGKKKEEEAAQPA